MEKIKKNLGFGFMRLPMQGEEVDLAQTQQMVDAFLAAGFNYFDTAHGYLDGRSETALKACLTSRYPREDYVLTNKLTANFFKTEADIRPFFESQLAACGVDDFDFYLMHAQSMKNFEHFKVCRAYETAFALKAEGKVRHVGISFHDSAEMLRKHGKPVIVMEPVKGGNLADLPEDAAAVLDALHGGSSASYAIRFAAGFPGIRMVLSGMSDLRQVEDNIAFMRDFKPLDETELAAVKRVQEIFRSKSLIPCTACRYCTAGCPQHISIPDLFAVMNAKQIHRDWNADYYYSETYTKSGGRASDCIRCGKCEKVCPQHLHIRDLLADVAAEFEKKG